MKILYKYTRWHWGSSRSESSDGDRWAFPTGGSQTGTGTPSPSVLQCLLKLWRCLNPLHCMLEVSKSLSDQILCKSGPHPPLACTWSRGILCWLDAGEQRFDLQHFWNICWCNLVSCFHLVLSITRLSASLLVLLSYFSGYPSPCPWGSKAV